MSNLGERLRKARERANLRQVQVYERTNINNKTLSRYENGGSEPDIDTLKTLAELYEVNLEWLLTGEESTSFTNIVKPDLQTFALRLTNGMTQKSITAEQAAESCGVTPEYIQKLMDKPDKLPGVGTLYKLADLIGVTPDYLGGFTGDPQGRSAHTPKPNELTDFLKKQDVMFHGVPLNEEDKQKIENVLIGLFWESKEMNKRKK